MAITSAEMFSLKQDIREASDTAVDAQNAISTHEQLCTLRYEGIQKELQAIKKWGTIGLIMLASLMKSDKLADVLAKMAGL